MDGSMKAAQAVQVRDPEQLERLEKLHASRQLPDRLERVDLALERLERNLDLLTTALGPVLRGEDPRAVLSSTPDDPRTELAAWLMGTAERVQRAVEYVEQLTERVDL